MHNYNVLHVDSYSEKDVCKNKVVNNANDDLHVTASYNADDAELALLGSGPYWQGDDDYSRWYAIVDNICCGMYTIEFEVYQTMVVDVHAREYGKSYELVQVS